METTIILEEMLKRKDMFPPKGLFLQGKNIVFQEINGYSLSLSIHGTMIEAKSKALLQDDSLRRKFYLLT